MLKPGTIITDGRTPEADVVNLLTDMLEEAKAGRIVGVAVAIEYDDSPKGNWTRAGIMSLGMIGRLGALQHRLVVEIEELDN